MKPRSIYISILCLCLNSLTFSVGANGVPGGIAIIDIEEEVRPQAYYQDKRVMVIGKPGAWQAVTAEARVLGAGDRRVACARRQAARAPCDPSCILAVHRCHWVVGIAV